MKINIDHYTQLRLISWNLAPGALIEEAEAFALYERNWRHVDHQNFTSEEKALVERLVASFGKGVMNV